MSKRKRPTTKNRRPRSIVTGYTKGSHAHVPTRAQRKAKRKAQKASRRRNRA